MNKTPGPGITTMINDASAKPASCPVDTMCSP
jgi:hypothetical protein